MRKSVPDSMFPDREQVRLSAFSNWVLDHGVTENCHDREAILEICHRAAALGKAMDDLHGPIAQRSRYARKLSEEFGIIRQTSNGANLTSGLSRQ